MYTIDKLYLDMTGHAWVSDTVQAHATHIADLPLESDVRWRVGVPSVADVEFITLSPFWPSGRLGVCVEIRRSNRIMYVNHPAFAGCKAWMPVSAATWRPIPRPEHTRYVVVDEHTLGYLIPDQPFSVGILAGNIFKGGPSSGQAICGIVPGNTSIRQANLEDFTAFRVTPPPCFQ